jgi:hypothetical protein
MIHGWFRIKDRKDRRAGFPIESRLRHFVRRFREIRKTASAWLSLLLEMEELWLQTRKRSEGEGKLRIELERLRQELNRGLHVAELRLAHMRARVNVPELRVPSRIALVLRDLDINVARRLTYTRADLNQFWSKTRQRWRCRQYFRIYPHRIVLNFMRDAQLFVLFAAALIRGRATGAADLRAWR